MIGIIAAMNVEMESLRSFMTDTTTETISVPLRCYPT